MKDTKLEDENSISRAPSPQNPKLMEVSIPTGVFLFRENDNADNFYIIQEGSIEISIENGTHVLATLTKGGSFGELALLGRGRRLASAMASTQTTCLEISMTWMQSELDRGLPSVKSMFAGLAMQLQQTNTAEVALRGPDLAPNSMIALPGAESKSDLLDIFLRSGSYRSIPLRSTVDIRNHIANGRALVTAEKGLIAKRGLGTVEFGEGGVIGLAECLAGTPVEDEFNFIAGRASVTAWIVDTSTALATIKRQNAGIIGILRGLTAAITKSDVSARFAK